MPCFTLVFTSLIHPSKYNKVKLEPYECGIEPTTDARDRYSIRYYLVAMLFVIFDVETVFMFPWAVIFDKLLLFGLIEMLVFIFILVVGFYYAWQKGALEWAYRWLTNPKSRRTPPTPPEAAADKPASSAPAEPLKRGVAYAPPGRGRCCPEGGGPSRSETSGPCGEAGGCARRAREGRRADRSARSAAAG